MKQKHTDYQATDLSTDAKDPYDQIPLFMRHRESELFPMFSQGVDLTDAYGRLMSRVVVVLGKIKPSNAHEISLRDLMADTFDFLYDWRRPLLEGRPHMAYPIGRRAYESLALLAAIAQDTKLAEKWELGHEIKNVDIRKALARSPFPESEDALRKLYNFFSEGSHPNRVLVANRFLGEGNMYVLGAIGTPSLVLIMEHFERLVSCWFWFGAVVTFTWKELLYENDPNYGKSYLTTANKVAEFQKWIRENFNRVLEEERSLQQKLPESESAK